MSVRRSLSFFAFVAPAFVALGLLAPTSAGHSAGSAGVSVVSIRALPITAQHGLVYLTPSRLNVVVATSDLGFRMRVRNNDTSPTSHVTVKVTIERHSLRPFVITKTIDAIGSHQLHIVTFSKIRRVPFAAKTSLRVTVVGGPSKVYPVIFALP
jgi:hypothetical protein